MDKDLIDNFYFSRFIDSLEQDYKEWSNSHFGDSLVSSEYSYSYYHSKTYVNDKKISLTFSLSSNGFVAYIGKFNQWKMPFMFRYNIFSHRTRRFRKAFNEMKKYVNNELKTKKLNMLMDAL